MRSLVVALVLVPAVAWGSGSVSLDLAEESFTLSIRQTFRKILDRDDQGSYVDGVRKEMAAHAATLLPALNRAVAGTPGLVPVDVGLPLVSCSTPACPELAGARFPARVELAPIRFGDDARLEYVVGVTFSRAPASLGALRSKLQGALKKVVDAEPGEPLDVAPLTAVEETAPSFTLRLRSELWARRALVARHDERLAAAAKRIRARLDAVFAALPPGIGLAPCTEKLPYYEDNKKRLPGKLSRHGDGRIVIYCLGKLDGEAALEPLNLKLDAALAE